MVWLYMYTEINIKTGAWHRMEKVMTRTAIREHIFKILFRIEFHTAEELDEQIRFYVTDIIDIKDKEIKYITDKTLNIAAKLEELDAMINEVSDGWPTSRLGKAELTILRLALYEMKYDEDIPDSVAINEAVELAKSYGSDNAAAFINGVLARYVKQ